MEQSKTRSQYAALTLTVLAALVRLVPHPPNFAPIGATALFGGARLRGWQAYIVPLLAMMVTDPILNWIYGVHTFSVMTLVIYGCFLLNVLLGRSFLRDTNSVPRIASIALLGSTSVLSHHKLVRMAGSPGSLSFDRGRSAHLLYSRSSVLRVDCIG